MTAKSGWNKLSDAERMERIHSNRRARMERVDAMPPEMRALVNEYGLAVIDTCTALGVKQPRHIKHLVETILDSFSPTRGCFSQQGIRTHVSMDAPELPHQDRRV